MRIQSFCSIVAFCGMLFANDVLPAAESTPLRGEVHSALQQSLRVSKDNREGIVHRLVELYGRMASDNSMNDRERKELRAQIGARLARLSAIIARQTAVEAPAAGRPAPNADAAGDVNRPAVDLPRDKQILAQRLPAPRPGFGRAVPNGGFGQRPGFARPAGFGFGANGGFAANQPPDNGPALVDLIQRTIEPSSWDINGGPGSIVYFAPSRVLVVRQRSEIHQQLQDVVRGLRK